MDTGKIIAMAGAALGGLAGAPAGANPPAVMPCGSSASATVSVRIIVAPFAEVTLDSATLKIVLPNKPPKSKGTSDFGPLFVGGTIRCNTPVRVSAAITAPLGAPGQWVAMVESTHFDRGAYRVPELLKIWVKQIPAGQGGGAYELKIVGQGSSAGGHTTKPEAGMVVVTVTPE